VIDVDVLLDDGAQALRTSRRVLGEARHLAVEIRDVILRYRPHRLRVISGGSTSRRMGVDSRVTLRSLLRSAPGDALCDACLAFACDVSLTEMRELTSALLLAEPDRFQRAPTCASCRRTVSAIICRSAGP
jgi:hypothetical protein